MTNARRARDLVLSFVSTVGNYDYGFEWIFHQDGTLEMRVALTGVMAAKAVADGAHDTYSHLVGKNLAAPHHQHFFTFRLDLDVDGARAQSRGGDEFSVPVATGKANPYGGAFQMVETELRTEREAQRNLNLATSRKWIVSNPASRNPLEQAAGYALLPGENAVLMAQPDSWVRRRAGFLNSHLWVTPYDAGGDVRGRRLSQPEPRRRRAAALDGEQPQRAESGCGGVVHAWGSRTIRGPRIGP